MVVQHRDPSMAGERVSRNGKVYRINADGRLEVPDDSGFDKIPDYIVVSGTPASKPVVHVDPNETPRKIDPRDGDLVVWQGPVEHVAGQRVSTRVGGIIQFDSDGKGVGRRDCGLGTVPGYSVVEGESISGRELPATVEEVEWSEREIDDDVAYTAANADDEESRAEAIIEQQMGQAAKEPPAPPEDPANDDPRMGMTMRSLRAEAESAGVTQDELKRCLKKADVLAAIDAASARNADGKSAEANSAVEAARAAMEE